MPRIQTRSNPFILMMDPQAVLSQIEHSERLERLQSRICRPLDKPQLRALAPHDLEIDAEVDEDLDDTTSGGVQ
jgi:hypothetical protein